MTTNSRRALLKSIAAGGSVIVAGKTLPDKWAKPAVDAIVLPAHAETSPPECCDIAGQFCGDVISQTASPQPIQITVSPDGTVVIDLPRGESATTSVPCFGGDFDTVTNPQTTMRFRVTGTVNCNSNSVSGTVQGNQDLRTYTVVRDCLVKPMGGP